MFLYLALFTCSSHSLTFLSFKAPLVLDWCRFQNQRAKMKKLQRRAKQNEQNNNDKDDKDDKGEGGKKEGGSEGET